MESFRETLKPLLNAYQSGLETGDLEYAAIAAHLYCTHLYLSGAELGKVAQEIATYSHAIAQLKQEIALDSNEITQQAVWNLMGKAENPCRLIGEMYNEEAMLPLHLEANIKSTLFWTYLNKIILCYLFEDFPQAVEISDKNKDYLDGVTGALSVTVFNLYDSLVRLAIFFKASNSEQKSILTQVKANQKKLQKWAHHAPTNYLHKFYLVEAERHRVLGESVQAMNYYESAIAKAKENEYLNEEALANELAAKFYLEWGKEQIAQVYMTNAYYCYARWGAKAKVNDLEKRYPILLAPILNREQNPIQQGETIALNSANTIHSSIPTTTSLLDLVGVMKASQAIFSEIQLERLLSILMKVVLENAGAKKSALMLLQSNHLVMEVAASLFHNEQETQTTVLQSIPFEESQEVPHSIINYVKNTLTTLVIQDVTTETNWVADYYIRREQPKSILCMPILKGGKLIGILYLENRLTAGAFTTDRVEFLKLLCSQAAISLENACLYKQAHAYAQQLEESLADLKQMQLQLVQSEKMSALGNLVAGVAHEINNPVGFIAGNIEPAFDYVNDLFGLLDLYQEKFPNPGAEIKDEIKTIDLEYVRQDLPKLLSSMNEGVERICSISNSLRTFSRADTENKVAFNIHDGIDSTILILKHRLKANGNRPEIAVIKDYGQLPEVQCFPGQLNQVFMNLLANAIDALEESNIGRSIKEIKANPNRITIKTSMNAEKKQVVISIKDNGPGMNESVKQRIFDHLFTTKPVGKGTGLGLAIAHQIIVEKHCGTINVNSAPGEGAEFAITLSPHCVLRQ